MEESLDWHTMNLPDEVELAELLYPRNPVKDKLHLYGGDCLNWQQAKGSRLDPPYYAAAAAMLAVIRVAQKRTAELDPRSNGGDHSYDLKGSDGGPMPLNAIDAERKLEAAIEALGKPEPLLPEGFCWMICELLGHNVHVGRVMQVEQFGAKMARVDVPYVDAEGKLSRWQTHWFTAASVYRLTETDEATVMKRAFKPPPQIGRYIHLNDDDPNDASGVDEDGY